MSVWLAVCSCEMVSGWASPVEPPHIAGAVALMAMLASAHWGER
jgi:hypothetical protein